MLDGMGTCSGNRLAHISAGDVIRLHSEYNSPTVQIDAMGSCSATSTSAGSEAHFAIAAR